MKYDPRDKIHLLRQREVVEGCIHFLDIISKKAGVKRKDPFSAGN